MLKSTGDTLKFLFVAEKDPRRIYWLLGVITLIALILRLFSINRPIGYDEAYTFIYFASKHFKYILADYHAPNNHILNSLLIGISYRILGSHIWIVRLPALIASVLSVPAVYFAVRRFFSLNQALAASAVLAVYPSFVHSTANGRGYMLVILFSFVLANIAGLLVKKQTSVSLLAYAITGALGFYSIPIFLYPMAGISLWVAVTHLTGNEPWRQKISRLALFLGACIVSGLLTFILYSPVIIFGTGLDSILHNEIVQSRSWSYFVESSQSQNCKDMGRLDGGSYAVNSIPAVRWISCVCVLLSQGIESKIAFAVVPVPCSRDPSCSSEDRAPAKDLDVS